MGAHESPHGMGHSTRTPRFGLMPPSPGSWSGFDNLEKVHWLLDRLDDAGVHMGQLWAEIGGVISQQAQEMDLLLVAPDGSPLNDHRGWLINHARLCYSMDDISVAEQVALKHPDTGFILIIDIDGFANLGLAVDSLIAFRKKNPGVAIVIASQTLSGHDFSVERAPVADVSLKLPVQSGDLSLAMGVALTNKASRPAF